MHKYTLTYLTYRTDMPSLIHHTKMSDTDFLHNHNKNTMTVCVSVYVCVFVCTRVMDEWCFYVYGE